MHDEVKSVVCLRQGRIKRQKVLFRQRLDRSPDSTNKVPTRLPHFLSSAVIRIRSADSTLRHNLYWLHGGGFKIGEVKYEFNRCSGRKGTTFDVEHVDQETDNFSSYALL